MATADDLLLAADWCDCFEDEEQAAAMRRAAAFLRREACNKQIRAAARKHGASVSAVRNAVARVRKNTPKESPEASDGDI